MPPDARKMLASFQGNVCVALLTLFPEHDWHFWKFEEVPNSVWEDSKYQVRFLRYIEQSMSIESPEGWYAVQPAHFFKHNGTHIRIFVAITVHERIVEN
jgi:hypothetical protein